MPVIRPSPWGVEGQVFELCGVGACDPVLRGSILSMASFVYDTSMFEFALAADAGNLTASAGQSRSYFETTTGSTIDGGWHAKTKADTNTLREAGMVRKGLQFIAFGLMAEILPPVQRGGTGAAASDPLLRSAWLLNAASGPNYSAELISAVSNYTTLRISVVDGGQDYDLGTLASFPTFQGPGGQGVTRNGNLTCVQFSPFPIAFNIGSEDSGQEVEITAEFGQNFAIQSSTPPTVKGTDDTDTDGTINTANVGTVHVAVRLNVIGVPMCIPDAALCGIPMSQMSAGQAAALAGRGMMPGR